ALAGSAVAGKDGDPVLLTQQGFIPALTAAELTRLKPANVVVLGGSAAVSDAVVSDLAHFASHVSRQSGTDRFATAAAVAAANYPTTVSTVYVATGVNFPDALVGGALAASQGAPLLLVQASGVGAATVTELAALHPKTVIVLGGSAAVPDSLLSQLGTPTAEALAYTVPTGNASSHASKGTAPVQLLSLTIPNSITTAATAATSAPVVNSFTWNLTTSPALLLSDGSNDYIYGPEGLPIEQISTSGTVLWLFHDQLGSTRVLTDSTGAVVGTASYSAYGTATTTGVTTALGYAGQYSDAESGLIYLRARYYDPATSQFMNVDPIVAQTAAPYSYVNDNPINEADPSGECGLFSCIQHFYERHKAVIIDGVDFASDALALASLLTPAGVAARAVTVVSALAGAASLLTSCDGSLTSTDCYAAIGGIALAALDLRLPEGTTREVSVKLGGLLLEDVSEVKDLVVELTHSAHSGAGTPANSSVGTQEDASGNASLLGNTSGISLQGGSPCALQ
ncbi:MAG: cell wall-binding repeat-containing protein, partial [Acidimicrobiales bacterium]